MMDTKYVVCRNTLIYWICTKLSFNMDEPIHIKSICWSANSSYTPTPCYEIGRQNLQGALENEPLPCNNFVIIGFKLEITNFMNKPGPK